MDQMSKDTSMYSPSASAKEAEFDLLEFFYHIF